jgi:hypothetical protein
MSDERDMTPALGEAGGPKFGVKSDETVALHIGEWRDGEWSYLYKDDTGYKAEERALGETPPISQIGHGMMKPPVWTWEVPLYFWTGGMASGAAFVALACDVAGDERAARISRLVSLAALAPSPALLVLDLGRPSRFLNMLRIVKTRSPMSMGAWALTVFGNLAGAAVGLDLLHRRQAKAVGGANAIVGGYLGSYTGVLLAATAVPLWSRSRLFLGPIFVCTATATGAAACRLAIIAAGESQESTRVALNRIQAAAMGAELLLSVINERRLDERIARPLDSRLMKLAKWGVRAGLALQATRRPSLSHVASVVYLGAGLAFRYAWVRAGVASATDDEAVAFANRPPSRSPAASSSDASRP